MGYETRNGVADTGRGTVYILGRGKRAFLTSRASNGARRSTMRGGRPAYERSTQVTKGETPASRSYDIHSISGASAGT